jgi:hypothetical protein
MKKYTPEWEGPDLKASDVLSEGYYTEVNGLVNFYFKVVLDAVEEFGTGPYTVSLPVAPALDYVLRDGGLTLNFGGHLPLSLVTKAGEKKAILTYSAPNSEELPFLPTRPTVLMTSGGGGTYFYGSGAYFSSLAD